jgi:hypothetical protein
MPAICPASGALTAERHCDGPVAAAAAGIAAKHDSVIASQAKQSMDAAEKNGLLRGACHPTPPYASTRHFVLHPEERPLGRVEG